MSKHILSVGDLVVDLMMSVHLPVEAEQHQVAASRQLEPGGGGNFILTARRLGGRVSAVGAVGDDLFGHELIRIFQHEGVDTAHIDITPNSTTTLVIALSDTAQNQHVFVGNYGEGQPITLTDRLKHTIQHVDGIYALGYAFVEQRTSQLARELLAYAKQHDKPVYLDAGPFMGQLPADEINVIVQQVDMLFATGDELSAVGGGNGVPLVVLKQGQRGCRLITQGMDDTYAALAADVVDTIGAGDCFGAAFMMAHLHEMPLFECAVIANAAGVASVRKVGAGRNVPTRAEIQAVLDEAGSEVKLPD